MLLHFEQQIRDDFTKWARLLSGGTGVCGKAFVSERLTSPQLSFNFLIWRKQPGGLQMKQKIYDAYIRILKKELIPAMGCTEPIAVAYAAAKAAEVLGTPPEHIEIGCSGNIIKNVAGVVVPHSGGQRGVNIAAILGALGGDATRKLEVLETVREEHRQKARELLQSDYCQCHLVKKVPNLYILVKATADGHTAQVEIRDQHTHITRITKDGRVIVGGPRPAVTADHNEDYALLNVRDIIDFADTVHIDDVKEILERQIRMNSNISREGLAHSYGADVGKILLKSYGGDIKIRAAAAAAAGSDARMGGCSLPVVINSGSGNQGITVSLPVIEFAAELGVPRERLYRALALSNLIAVHQKQYIGNLSAFCGAVSAASGSGAGITYLYGGNYETISHTITNTIANVGGIVCDGAKSSCAAKIASAVNAAVMASCMSFQNREFQPGEGLVKENVEKTIRSVGRLGKKGMSATDEEILRIMTEKS